jgi:DNA-binding CsgD family transcriptional regulator
MNAEGYSPKRVAKFMSISEEQVSSALKFASILLEQ